MLRKAILLPALSALTTRLAYALTTENCPNLGPAFPHDFDLKDSKPFQSATATFPDVLEKLFSTGLVSQNTSTFSIDVFSTSTNESVYSYHHVAPGNNGTLTAGKLDDESIYRVGSVTKLYTAYAILATAGIDVLERPVTDYVPELAGGVEPHTIAWKDVTIGALMSQQAGAGGVPLEASLCFVTPTADCPIQNVQDFIQVMRDRTRPVTMPFANPLYSDASWAILGIALERLSGLTYDKALKNSLGKPLGLNGTSAVLPPSEGLNAVVIPKPPGPNEATGWGLDNPITAGTGNVYSNNADLRAVGLSILHSTLLPPTTTREWMKPRGNTGTLTTQVGAPWEINRLSLPITANSTRTRVSDLYTKLGGNPQYAAVFGLSPDHGLGFSILIAGPQSTADRVPLRNAVVESFVVAAEHAAAQNAKEKLTGTFVDEVAQGANLTLTVDNDRPGLGLENIYINGTNVLASILSPDLVGTLPPANVSVRLYPMGIEWQAPNATDATIHSSYRAFAQVTPGNVRADSEGGGSLIDDCTTWQNVGFFSYNGVASDEFILERLDGKLQSVVYPFNGNTFAKVA